CSEAAQVGDRIGEGRYQPFQRPQQDEEEWQAVRGVRDEQPVAYAADHQREHGGNANCPRRAKATQQEQKAAGKAGGLQSAPPSPDGGTVTRQARQARGRPGAVGKRDAACGSDVRGVRHDAEQRSKCYREESQSETDWFWRFQRALSM